MRKPRQHYYRLPVTKEPIWDDNTHIRTNVIRSQISEARKMLRHSKFVGSIITLSPYKGAISGRNYASLNYRYGAMTIFKMFSCLTYTDIENLAAQENVNLTVITE